MFCPNCGKEIPDIAKFCPICGSSFAAAVEQSAPPPVPEAEPDEAPTMIFGSAVPESDPVTQLQEEPVAEAEPDVVPQEEVVPQAEEVAPQYEAALPPQYEAAPAPQYEAAPQYLAAPAQAAKKPNMKLIAIIASAAVVVVVLIVLIVTMMGGMGGSSTYIGTQYNINTSDETVYVLCGDKLISEIEVDADEDELIYLGLTLGISFAVDDSAMAMLTTGRELYYFKGDTEYLVSDDENISNFRLSDDGSALAYLINDDGDYTLNLYTDGKSIEIAESESADDGYWFYYEYALSPDGSTVVYTTYDKKDKYTISAYKNGKTYEVAEDLDIGFVTENGKYIYLHDSKDNKLMVYENFTNEIAKIKHFDQALYSSDDNETLIYYDDNDDCVMIYHPSMEKPIELTEDETDLVYAPYTINNFSNFDDFIAECDDNIVRFVRKGDKYEEIKIASNVDDYKLSRDGKKMVYTKKGSLYIVDVTAKKPEPVKIFSDMDDYASVYGSDDLKHLYFYDEDGNLMYSNGKPDSAVEIADDDVNSCIVTADGNCLYLYEYEDKNNNYERDSGDTAELYCSFKGGKPVQVSDPDEAYSLSRLGDYIYIRIDDELFITKDCKKFEKPDVELG